MAGKFLATGLLFILALALFINPVDVLSPTEEMNQVDRVTANWTDNGNLSGNMIVNADDDLSLSGDGSGTYRSNVTYVAENSSLSFDNVVVVTDYQDDNDNGEIRVFGVNRDGVIQESENIQLEDGTTQYGLDERISSSNEYEGYYYEILLESTDNQVPTINRVTMEYDVQKPLTDNSLASDLLAWLLVLAGIGVLFQ